MPLFPLQQKNYFVRLQGTLLRMDLVFCTLHVCLILKIVGIAFSRRIHLNKRYGQLTR